MSEDEAVITKVDRRRRMTSVRLLPETYVKLDMLKRETGRSYRDIIEILIKMAKVGEYDKGD
jgi:predicted DNA-binding protein